jgi:hypothetical protein
VTIAPGQTGRVEFSFRPPWLYAGTGILVFAAIASALVWRKRTRAVFSAQT